MFRILCKTHLVFIKNLLTQKNLLLSFEKFVNSPFK